MAVTKAGKQRHKAKPTETHDVSDCQYKAIINVLRYKQFYEPLRRTPCLYGIQNCVHENHIQGNHHNCSGVCVLPWFIVCFHGDFKFSEPLSTDWPTRVRAALGGELPAASKLVQIGHYFQPSYFFRCMDVINWCLMCHLNTTLCVFAENVLDGPWKRPTSTAYVEWTCWEGQHECVLLCTFRCFPLPVLHQVTECTWYCLLIKGERINERGETTGPRGMCCMCCVLQTFLCC